MCESEWPTGSGSARRCPEKLGRAFPRLTADELHRLRPETSYAPDVEQQGPSACVDHGGFTWFGISFYDSEGVTGVGGIGRFEPRTGNVEIHRPRLLLASSSTALAHDGRWLWLKTFRIGEGYSEPTHGLVRYDWARDELVQEIDGPCGFSMVGAVVLDGALWVAHDAGLSRRDARGRWQHFVLPAGREPTAVPTGCDGVYAFARSKLPDDGDLRRMFDEEIRLWRSEVQRRAP